MSRWRVVLSPSVFRDTMVLGEYRWAFQAWFAAFCAVLSNPYARATVQYRATPVTIKGSPYRRLG